MLGPNGGHAHLRALPLPESRILLPQPTALILGHKASLLYLGHLIFPQMLFLSQNAYL